MAQVISNSGHDDMIHDAVLDYYGRRLATCSSDKTIKIFEVEGESHRLTETLKGHEGAVWCVAWAHPKFGSLLASASYDGRVIIWRENTGAQGTSTWTPIYTLTTHTASVNLISFSPHEIGCHLGTASSDGHVTILTYAPNTNAWEPVMFQAHGIGVNSISWAPAIAPGGLTSASTSAAGQQAAQRRFVTGGSDCLVKIWGYNTEAQTQTPYACMNTLTGHSDWVRDVAWSPTVLSKSYIASASQDKTVRIWTSSSNPNAAGGKAGEWTSEMLTFDAVAWRVSWSLSGNVLAVSTGDNRVSLWKEKLSGGWEHVKSIEE